MPIISPASSAIFGGPNGGDLLRSASFHYPDGVSKVHLNVYTSEGDDEDGGGGDAANDPRQQPREFPSGKQQAHQS